MQFEWDENKAQAGIQKELKSLAPRIREDDGIWGKAVKKYKLTTNHVVIPA